MPGSSIPRYQDSAHDDLRNMGVHSERAGDEDGSSSARVSNDEYLIAPNYFAGWWRKTPNLYVREEATDWRRNYPGRIPLLGMYNDQSTMDAEIYAASAYGIDAFEMLWYPPFNVGEEYVKTHKGYSTRETLRSDVLNRSIAQFMASDESHRMGFYLHYANDHTSLGANERSVWREFVDEWITIMKHPQYLHVGERPMFKIFRLSKLYHDAGDDLDEVKWRFDYLRESVEAEGLNEPLIGAGLIPPRTFPEPVEPVLDEQFDFISSYSSYWPGNADETGSRSYDELTEKTSEHWKMVNELYSTPYMPALTAGYDHRAWGRDDTPRYNPSAEDWERSLRTIKLALDENPGLRVPDGSKEGQKMFNVYAWNEFGEGGYMAPTVDDGWMKLEVLADIFG